jgi:hypothetical protein
MGMNSKDITMKKQFKNHSLKTKMCNETKWVTPPTSIILNFGHLPGDLMGSYEKFKTWNLILSFGNDSNQYLSI